jgi:hypothetical protein
MNPLKVTSKEIGKREGVIVKFVLEQSEHMKFQDSLWAVVVWDDTGEIQLVPVEVLVVE